ncbi:hypothetical protein EDD68_103139 [Melghiribacillus thermohalophilus]|uniref:ABC transporter periplasmic binding protein yphF n=1 Tax=Melghiribacillus thermohalophilus TaxID=1324956 RepID=A0A4R3NAC6_9BACI|nr:hypothetical protein [Melghiribacillus thermohalophilus]TCT25584.1 hypothetical protein EDD68_103139 [Melghiribacillus thermohalophilus]
MKRIKPAFILGITLLLTGCLYPEDRLAKNQVPNEVQLQTVQEAVVQFQEASDGLLPIKTRHSDTPIFQKYPVDFEKLREYNLMGRAPGNSFEEGGKYQYVIIHPETEPTVKVIDLRMAAELRKMNTLIEIYRNEHIYPPFGKQVAEGIYRLNHESLGLETEPYVESPYSGQPLPIVLNVQGEIFIDYSRDLYQALQKFEHEYEYGDDIRYILAENYPFVPAYSLPYTIQDGEPVFMEPQS